ncbi:MAG: hypothetical protein IJB62_04405 [Alistipes sp.]|nr:hypothetical protein [Alistipes sp.]
MIFSVSSQLYEEVLARLTDKIDARNYFSGSFSFEYEEVVCRMVVSCFVYRRPVVMPEGAKSAIVDLVPVWWEFHTTDSAGERLNDFSFSELRRLLHA